MNALKLGELCAGYGGLGLAVEEAFGAELAWYSEFDAAPSKIMATHWPDVPNHGDMTAIDWSAVEPVDIISGGTPCQDLSAAGRRKGMTEGTRSNLWVNMREAIATIKPKHVAWENVRGAYSAGADSELEFCPGCMGTGGGGQGNMFCEHSDVYSETFPTSGMTRNGVAYELPTWERRTDDTEPSSSQPVEMLPTPMTSDWKGSAPADWERNSPQLRAVDQLLGTPRCADGMKADLWNPTNIKNGNAKARLEDQVAQLLPTPTVGMTQGGNRTRSGSRSDELLLNGLVETFTEMTPSTGETTPRLFVDGKPCEEPPLPLQS